LNILHLPFAVFGGKPPLIIAHREDDLYEYCQLLTMAVRSSKMGWGEDEGKRIREDRERKRMESERAAASKQQLPQRLNDTWAALVSQVKADVNTFERGSGRNTGLQCLDLNENNLTVQRPVQPLCKLEIVRTGPDSIEVHWSDDSSTATKAVYKLNVAQHDDSPEMSRQICEPLVKFLRKHFSTA
jgi:hypothetical protein